MPWHDSPVLYLRGPDSIDGLAVDYGVDPLARVDFVRAEFDFDRAIDRPPRTTTGACPASIPASLWTLDESNEVVGAKLIVGADGATPRRAYVYYPSGSHSLDLDVGSIDSVDRVGSWYFIYEPAWGSSRMAVFPISFDDDTVHVTGLPDGPAHVALVRTPRPISTLEGATDALLPPTAFAELWVAFADRWFGARIDAGTSSPIAMRLLRGDGDDSSVISFWEAPSLPCSDSAGVCIIPFGINRAEGHITIACDGATRVLVPFAATVTAALDGMDVVIAPGDEAVLDPACSGTDVVSVPIAIESTTSDGFLVVRAPR